jgi:hypothetical protein
MSTLSKAAKTAASAVADERLSAASVIERMKESFAVTSDAKLAEAIRTSRQNISKWRARNSVPYVEAVYVSFLRNVSLDFLLTGDTGETTKLRRPSKLDSDILRAVLLNLHGMGIISIPPAREPTEALESAAKAIAFQYARAEEVIGELISKKGLQPDDARNAAILATELLGSDGTVFKNNRSSKIRR